MAREGISEDYARLRVAAQKKDDYYRENCTDIWLNTSSSAEEFCRIAMENFQKIQEEINHE